MGDNEISWGAFYDLYTRVNSDIRMGQLFICLCIKDEQALPEFTKGLWNRNDIEATFIITRLMEHYQWDTLPLLNTKLYKELLNANI